MKTSLRLIFLISVAIAACKVESKVETEESEFVGTWKLISGTLIEKGDTATTDYTKDLSMIKIINATHFSFLNHDLNKGKDSTKVFVAGGGRYTLMGDQYTEFLEYCSDRNWEGHEFAFTVTIKNDTLIQSGVEKVEDAGIERQNTEKYVRLK